MPSPWPFAMLAALALGAAATQAQAVDALQSVPFAPAREIRSENGVFLIVRKEQEEARLAAPHVPLGAHVRLDGLLWSLDRQKVAAR